MDNVTYNEQQISWIIDTDWSDDDKIAIHLILKNLRVLAITTVGSKDKSPYEMKCEIENFLIKNNYKDINVYAGADRPYVDFNKQHGDKEIFNPYVLTNQNSNEKNEAVGGSVADVMTRNYVLTKITNIAGVKLLELAKEHKQKLGIFTTGPLTNLALAASLDNEFSNYLTEIVITGGSEKHNGNTGTNAEYNIRYDCISSFNLLRYSKNSICKFTLIPIEVELQAKELLTPEILNKISKKSSLGSSLQEFFNILNNIQPSIDPLEQRYYSGLSIYSSLVFINRSLIKEANLLPCTVDYFGRESRGMLIIDVSFEPDKSDKTLINIVKSISQDSFIELLLNNIA